MPTKNIKNKFNPIILAIIIAMIINPSLSIILIIILIIYVKKNPKSSFFDLIKKNIVNNTDNQTMEQLIIEKITSIKPLVVHPLSNQIRLVKNKKYLQIALNSTLEEAREIISQIPVSDRILIEAGTPLIKIYGAGAISQIRNMASAGTYIVADNKCADLAAREVEMMANAGANASTCLGVAPIETIDSFIEECEKFNIDSMIDMMNVENALLVLKKLKKLPNAVILHRGVDESEFSKEKQIPYYQIKQIKGNYNILVAVAGGDTIREVQRAIFNDADIVVVWKNFYQPNIETAKLAESFLGEIK
ncbi:MAG: orotidine 5'-phosphate decarboxylase [Patescibacteria group bacterium]|nr:orotidine 5'-phosphate decarboxylase [Patescibacteria group bacterium]MDD5164507.1 orotidine 5'-phosphate decarboxylase [Patescibacteria group bacterium]MDD5534157.1 orotidine 5'-phosphate decarboxylase [Patescibacteria group bacterium]